MRDEFAFHLESRTRDLIRQGLSAQEARRRAQVEFGSVESYKEQTREAFRHLLRGQGIRTDIPDSDGGAWDTSGSRSNHINRGVFSKLLHCSLHGRLRFVQVHLIQNRNEIRGTKDQQAVPVQSIYVRFFVWFANKIH
jgi:hypothetical protein